MRKSIGAAGVVVYWVVALLLLVAPMAILRLSWWARSLLVFVMMLHSVVGVVVRAVLYIWAMFNLGGCPPVALVLFWISFVLYLVFELFPLGVALFSLMFTTGRSEREL